MMDEMDALVAADDARMEEEKRIALERMAEEQRKAAFEAEQVLQAQRAESERVRGLKAELARVAGTGNVINDPVSFTFHFSLIHTDIST